MAKLKKLDSIKNWDVLDKFYGYKVEGYNIQIENLSRSFCRCGETNTSFQTKCPKCGNTKFITKVNDIPSIRNTVKKYYTLNYDIIDSKFVDIEDFRHVELSLERLSTENNYTELEFQVTSQTMFNFEKNHADINTRNFREIIYYEKILTKEDYLLSKINKGFEIFENEMNEIYNIIGEDYFDDKISTSIDTKDGEEKTPPQFIEFIKNLTVVKTYDLCKLLLNCPEKGIYPHIVYGRVYDAIESILSEHFNRWCTNSVRYYHELTTCNFGSLLKKDYKPYLNLINTTCKTTKSLDSAIYSSREAILGLDEYSYRGTDCNIVSFIKYLDEKKTGYEDLMFHYVQNGMILWKEAWGCLEEIYSIQNDLEEGNSYSYSGAPMNFPKNWKYFKPTSYSSWYSSDFDKHIDFRSFFRKDYLEFFPIYLKENIANRKTTIFLGFIEQIKTMVDHKIPIVANNFKIKTYNFLINQSCLAETYRLPQEKVDLFLDMFEVNPIKAMELIANRRKLTKKEQKDFLDIMLK